MKSLIHVPFMYNAFVMLIIIYLLFFPQLDEAEVLVASTAGEMVDNRTRADIVREQERMIKEEQKESKKEKKTKTRRVSCINYTCTY